MGGRTVEDGEEAGDMPQILLIFWLKKETNWFAKDLSD